MDFKNHPIEKEQNLPNLHFWVQNHNFPWCTNFNDKHFSQCSDCLEDSTPLLSRPQQQNHPSSMFPLNWQKYHHPNMYIFWKMKYISLLYQIYSNMFIECIYIICKYKYINLHHSPRHIPINIMLSKTPLEPPIVFPRFGRWQFMGNSFD